MSTTQLRNFDISVAELCKTLNSKLFDLLVTSYGQKIDSLILFGHRQLRSLHFVPFDLYTQIFISYLEIEKIYK